MQDVDRCIQIPVDGETAFIAVVYPVRQFQVMLHIAAINILHMGLIKVGKKVGRGTPEFTPVESATAAELSKGGLRVATL